MSDVAQQTVSVKILGRNYSIQRPAHEETALQEAIQLLEAQMSLVKADNQLGGIEQIAIVTALNICYELTELRRKKKEDTDVMNRQIQDLQRRIVYFLKKNNQVTLPAEEV